MELGRENHLYYRRYSVRAHQEGKWWIVEIPRLLGQTKVRCLSDIGPASREWIAMALGLEVDEIEITLTVTHHDRATEVGRGQRHWCARWTRSASATARASQRTRHQCRARS